MFNRRFIVQRTEACHTSVMNCGPSISIVRAVHPKSERVNIASSNNRLTRNDSFDCGLDVIGSFFSDWTASKKKIERWGWRGHVIGCDEQRQMQTVWARNNMRFNGVVSRESRTCARRKNREGQCRGKCHLTGRLRSLRHCAQLICIVKGGGTRVSGAIS